jgi:hypothetical protein
MCDHCKPIDEQIERCRRLEKAIYDKQTLDGIKRLLADLEAKKLLLHPKD